MSVRDLLQPGSASGPQLCVQPDRGGLRGVEPITAGRGRLTRRWAATAGEPRGMKGPFQLFIPVLWAHLRSTYPFVSRPRTSLCEAIPKSSSFYCGISPRFGKHTLIQLQHSPKPWSVGEFCLNVHLSTELAPTKNWLGAPDSYALFEDGYYRLSTVVQGKDIWWCLAPKRDEYSMRSGSRTTAYWEPSSYDDQAVAFAEAAVAVGNYLEEHVFSHGGFRT
jgi:hypothetical protein